MIRQYALFRFITSSVDSDYKVIVFDGMAVVNKIDITKMNLKSCSDFASAYVQKVKKEAQGFNEVCVIYEELGMKLFAIKFLMTLLLKHLTTKQLLSDIKTMQDLIKYLRMKLYDVFQNVAFAVSYEFTCFSNISDIDARLNDHCYKEADTCIVLCCIHLT